MAPASARCGMPWYGILSQNDRDRLDRDFGSVVICPGFCGEFGKVSDEWDRVYIPAAAVGYAAARKRLVIWQQKIVQDEKYNWWPDTASRMGVSVFTVSNALAGLQKAAWDRYRNQYRLIREKRSQRRIIRNAREEAKRSGERDRPLEAAKTLTQLQEGH